MTDIRHNYDTEQVRERTDLLALIGQHVVLKKRGGRYLGLCPFHQEKTPSFNVDPQKGFWKCFGCGEGGDAFNFLMKIEHLTFPEALERLAERAGIQPTSTTYDAPKRKEERDFLFEVNEAAAVAFHNALVGQSGAAARAYLQGRGITTEHAKRFALGYAPAGWDALVKHLRGRGFSLEVMAKAGLALARSSGDGYIDRFRNRLMIPIHDRQGRVVAFGGRAMLADDNPKYLNTAETPIFHKSRTLYLLHQAAEGIARQKRAIITEGYFDAIACHLAGFSEAVATLGTALSEEHAQLLHRLTERVFLVFDADSAGINAALRSQAIFRQQGVDVRIVRLPVGHDPDTLLREGGAEAFERCLAAALSPVEFELERLIAQHPERDVESRIRLFRAAAQVLQPLPRLERSEYALRLIDRWLGGTPGNAAELQQAILGEIAVVEHQQYRKAYYKKDEQPEEPVVAEVALERDLLISIVHDVDFAGKAIAVLPVEAFTHKQYRAVFSELVKLCQAGTPPDIKNIIDVDPEISSLLASLALSEHMNLHSKEMSARPTVDKLTGGKPIPPEGMLEMLLEVFEQSQHRLVDVENRAALEEFTARQIERSRRAARREGLDL